MKINLTSEAQEKITQKRKGQTVQEITIAKKKKGISFYFAHPIAYSGTRLKIVVQISHSSEPSSHDRYPVSLRRGFCRYDPTNSSRNRD